jgi:hypothetical protein
MKVVRVSLMVPGINVRRAREIAQIDGDALLAAL